MRCRGEELNDELAEAQAKVKAETLVVIVNDVDTEKMSTRCLTTSDRRRPRHSLTHKALWSPTYW